MTTPFDELNAIYRDLHQHPELSEQETRTAGVVARVLEVAGWDVTPGVGGTGVVAIMHNGDGPTAYLRADMDALPVEEATGLPYASTERGTDPAGNDVPVMHACGHDMHVTCLLGAAAELARDRRSWAGTATLVFQPAEEIGRGARAMLADGLFERFGKPDVVLGQHVAPLPAGALALRAGAAFAASDSLRITLYGRGAHGSRPEASIDPIVMAASVVLRLQGIVARELAATETAVVTIGSLHSGTKNNIIPDVAELLLSVRTFDPGVRTRVLDAIERIARAEAVASNAPREAEVTLMESFPVVFNDPAGVERTQQAFAAERGADRIIDPGVITGSEDVGLLSQTAGVPGVYWLLGGADPTPFLAARSRTELENVARELPSNHSPFFAPLPEPTIRSGVSALLTATREWLPIPAS